MLQSCQNTALSDNPLELTNNTCTMIIKLENQGSITLIFIILDNQYKTGNLTNIKSLTCEALHGVLLLCYARKY